MIVDRTSLKALQARDGMTPYQSQLTVWVTSSTWGINDTRNTVDVPTEAVRLMKLSEFSRPLPCERS